MSAHDPKRTCAEQEVSRAHRGRKSLSDFSQIMMVLIAAAVRHAIFLPPKEGRRILALFKRMLPKDLSALET